MIFTNASTDTLRDYYINTRDFKNVSEDVLAEEVRTLEEKLEEVGLTEEATRLNTEFVAEVFQFNADSIARWYKFNVTGVFEYQDGYVRFTDGTYAYSPRLHGERALSVVKRLLDEHKAVAYANEHRKSKGMAPLTIK